MAAKTALPWSGWEMFVWQQGQSSNLTEIWSRRGKNFLSCSYPLNHRNSRGEKTINKTKKNLYSLGHVEPWAGYCCCLLATGSICELWLCSPWDISRDRHVPRKSDSFRWEANMELPRRTSCWQVTKTTHPRPKAGVTQLLVTGSGDAVFAWNTAEQHLGLTQSCSNTCLVHLFV